MRALLLLPVLLSAACWSPRYFTPREHVDAIGPDRSPAAQYTVPAAPGAPAAAELRVWARGAFARYADDDREIVELFVGFELENNGTEPLQLDLGALQLEELMIDGVLQPAQAPLRIAGDGTAAPGQTARVDLVFEPATTKPRAIDSFQVRFAVTAGDRVALQQVTPFVPWLRNLPDEPYPYHGSWAFGAGFAFGWHHPGPFFCR